MAKNLAVIDAGQNDVGATAGEDCAQGVGAFGADKLVIRGGDDGDGDVAAGERCDRIDVVAQQDRDGQPPIELARGRLEGIERGDEDQAGQGRRAARVAAIPLPSLTPTPTTRRGR